MLNMLFKPRAAKQILDTSKVMTARCWLPSHAKKFQKGMRVTASTGRRADTRFAILEITDIWEWDGIGGLGGNAHKVTGIFRNKIGRREGYRNWKQFYRAYFVMNEERFHHPERKHYFIAFKLVEETLKCNGMKS